MRTFLTIAKIYCIIAAVLMALSLIYFAVRWGENASYKLAKATLASTDLSGVTVGGLKPGMTFDGLSQGAFVFGEDGRKYNSYSGGEIQGVVISSITADLFWNNADTIEYKGQVLNTAGRHTTYNSSFFAEQTAYTPITEALGENYLIRSIRHESLTPSVIYRDQANGLELRLYYYGAELSKADAPLDLPDYKRGVKDSTFLLALTSPLFELFTISFIVGSGLNMPLIDHILLPLWFAALLLPAGCCFRFRRKRVVIPIVLGYIVLCGVQFFMLMAMASRM